MSAVCLEREKAVLAQTVNGHRTPDAGLLAFGGERPWVLCYSARQGESRHSKCYR